MNTKLSIIIPCYNAEPYIGELLGALDKQITDDVEVIIIDDGSKKPFRTSYKWARVIRQDNGGASAARNRGLDEARGDYIAFIDADDLVSKDYISKILSKIEQEQFDYCYLSWKTLPGGWRCEVKLNSIKDKFPSFNLCVWNRVYKRSMIGDVRFNTKKLIAEDAQFIREVKEECKKKAFIGDCIYFYRSDTPNSLTKRFQAGSLDTQRVGYYFKHVTKDMKYLIEDFREADKNAEVILMTHRNDIPELERYAMVIPPTRMTVTECRGEKTHLFSVIEKPLKTQVVVYVSAEQEIGGIETWVYNFCEWMHKYYDITVLYDAFIDTKQLIRLIKYVPVVKNSKRLIECDTVINCRVVKSIPVNVKYRQSIQMAHTCQMGKYQMPQNCDIKVFVSEVAARSFNENEGDYEVIHNLTAKKKPSHRPLILVSATRLTEEKGGKRMRKFAKAMTDAGIDFIWLYFTYQPIKDEPKGMVHMDPEIDIAKYIKMADYMVHLSDIEAFGYSIVEALEFRTPVIVTPLEVLDEIGFKDGETGYIVPFEVDGFDFSKIKKPPVFDYKYDNAKIVMRWRRLLGDSKPEHSYKPRKIAKVIVKKEYFDLKLQEKLNADALLDMDYARAVELQEKDFVTIVD